MNTDLKSNITTDAGIEQSPMLAEVPTAEGRIHISHSVECPHCEETMYDDCEWWDKNVTDQLPNEEEYRSKIEINCKERGNPFIIDGFVY